MGGGKDRRPGPLRIGIVVGEESGDQLGAGLMRAIRARLQGAVEFRGVGGTAMEAEGLASLFPLREVAVMGVVAIAKGLPRMFERVRRTAKAMTEADLDALVIVDSPEFTHRIARRVREAAPQVPIINYVPPTVWAWRPGRARPMRAYVDHALALLPFEPAAYAKLGGPPCTYVGHPLAERIAELRPNAAEARRRLADPPVVLVLPGSRRAEVRHTLGPFRAAIDLVRARLGTLELALPTLPHLVDDIRADTADWPSKPRIILDAQEKRAAFRVARAALAGAGTVTLELALAGIPTVASYRVAAIDAVVMRIMVRVPSLILANLALGENVVPEFFQDACTPERLAEALIPLIGDTSARQRQLDAFARFDTIMETGKASPSDRAAEIVISLATKR